MPAEARCGTYEVFENRTSQTGRKIPLKIVVLPATGPGRLPDPFVYFAGGPGEAAIPWGLYVAEGRLPSLRQKRDVLLVDLRGTGMSGGLFCPELQGNESVQGFLDDFLPTEKVRACRDRLKKEGVDLSWYTTDATVDDVEEVRTALGYGPLNLMGTSYGTRLVLTYLRRHPRSVRTATLEGILPPDVRHLLLMPRNTQAALDGLITECEGDPACRGAFPKLREEVDAVLRRATVDPVRIELINPEAGQIQELRLTRTAVAQTLRYMLYTPVDGLRVPLELHLAAQGDWKPLALSARFHSGMGGSAEALYQSVTCAEDVAPIRDEEIAAAVAGTFLGDFRLRRQKAACEGWPVRDLDPDLQTPVVSDVPALLISGERDPATPPSNGERAARTLKRARHLVVADAAHSTDGLEGADCVSGLIAAFVEAGTPEGLDTSSCLSRIRRPDFPLSFGDPEVALAQADLERLPGSYALEGGPTARVDLLGNRVRFGMGRGPGYLLIPTSPTRFRVEGLPPGHKVAFQVTEGKVTGLTLSQPGRPDLVMTRSATPQSAAEPEVTVAQADLERLQGSYASQEMGMVVKVDLQGNRARLSITQGPPFPPALLIPTSPTRFRWEGEGLAPGLAVVFQVTEGKATALTIVQPGAPEVVLTRQ
jgi:pimeloyl-ACP methyl ester carboxylesterase